MCVTGWEIVRKPNTHLLTNGDRAIIDSNIPGDLTDRATVYKILSTTKPINYEEDLDPGMCVQGISGIVVERLVVAI